MSRATQIAAFAALVTLSFACRAQSPAMIAEQLYDQRDQSYDDHNLYRALSFLDPASYVYLGAKGRRLSFAVTRDWMLKVFTLSQYRNFNQRTRVRAVQMRAGRMVVYFDKTLHCDAYVPRAGWVPVTQTTNGQETWARRGGQWKLVLTHTFRDNIVVDPRGTTTTPLSQASLSQKQRYQQTVNLAAYYFLNSLSSNSTYLIDPEEFDDSNLP